MPRRPPFVPMVPPSLQFDGTNQSTNHLDLDASIAIRKRSVCIPIQHHVRNNKRTKSIMQGFEEELIAEMLSSHRGPPDHNFSREVQNQRIYADAIEAVRRLNSPRVGINHLKKHYRDALDIEFDELVGKASKRSVRLLKRHFADYGIRFCSGEFVDAVFGHGLIHYENELVFQVYGTPS